MERRQPALVTTGLPGGRVWYFFVGVGCRGWLVAADLGRFLLSDSHWWIIAYKSLDGYNEARYRGPSASYSFISIIIIILLLLILLTSCVSRRL